MFKQHLTAHAVLTFWVPVKIVFLVLSQHFKICIILLKWFYIAPKNPESMTMSTDLGPHKPKWMNG